jgi:uncharacterized lipoprotein YajG
MLRIAATLVAVLLVAGCASNADKLTPPISTPCVPPTDLMVQARGPTPLPRRDLTQKDVVALWGKDRAAFRKEADRRNDLSGFVAGQCR